MFHFFVCTNTNTKSEFGLSLSMSKLRSVLNGLPHCNLFNMYESSGIKKYILKKSTSLQIPSPDFYQVLLQTTSYLLVDFTIYIPLCT